MKKKIIFVAITLVISTILLTACNLLPGSSDVYADLNEMVAMDYDNVALENQTTYNGVTLVDKYIATKSSNGNTMVTYSSERLATIEKDANGNYVVPKDMIVTKSGSVIIENGEIVDQSGDVIDLPVTQLEKINLKFDEKYFTDVKTYADGNMNVFEAKVKTPWAFLDNPDFHGKDMSVMVRYGDKLNVVVVDYTSQNGATVKVTYSFR